MLFDTGSAVIYAMSDKCTKADCPQKMEKYDSRSKTLEDTRNERQELNYGSGYVSGTIATENLCFGGTKCINQAQMLIGDIGKQMEQDKFSGIIGLAPQNDPNNHL